MTQEEKQLLLIDICARLPYNVVVNCTEDDDERTNFNCFLTADMIKDIQSVAAMWNVKPYLRPMSSMTEEEENEFKQVLELELKHLESEESGHTIIGAAASAFEIDFYNKHHLDYRGLIPMGLALEAPKNMYEL